MATTTGIFSANLESAKAVSASRPVKRRSIDPETWHAMVTLSHAIQYLADEFACHGGSLIDNRSLVDAIQLLMRLNRETYLSCPVAPTVGQWIKSSLRKLLNGAAKPRIQETFD